VSPGRRAYQYGRVPRPILYAESGVSDRACRLFAILTVEQFASKEDSPDPSLEEMAQWLGCSVDTAIRAVRELERAGMVERRKRRNGQRQATSEYILPGQRQRQRQRPQPQLQTRTHASLTSHPQTRAHATLKRRSRLAPVRTWLTRGNAAEPQLRRQVLRLAPLRVSGTRPI
jgi:DNA-binding transcriptional MocR family regulator